MKQISYTSTETYFVAGIGVDHARQRLSQYGGEVTAQRAWNALDYWDREEHSSQFEVFEFQVTEKITKVDPPYTN